jgi:hypothetical protein
VPVIADVAFLADNPERANLSLKTGNPPEIFAYGPGGPGFGCLDRRATDGDTARSRLGV